MTESTEDTPSTGQEKARPRRWIVTLVTCLIISIVLLSIALRPKPDGGPTTTVYENYGFPLIATGRTAPCLGAACGFSGGAVAVADLDADGEREIVAVGGGQPSGPIGSAEFVTIWHFTSGGELVMLGEAWNKSLSYAARAVELVDLDNDGLREIVTGGWARWYGIDAAYLSVWRWQGFDLTRIAHANWTWAGADTQFTDMVTGDLDSDGQIEVLAVAYAEPTSGPRVGQVTVWNASAGLDALQQEASATFSSAQGDIELHAASIVGSSILVAGRATDWANGTVSGILGLLSYDGTTIRSVAERFNPDITYLVMSEADPSGPNQSRLLAGGSDASGKTFLQEISANDSNVWESPRLDYRVRSRPDVFTGFRDVALAGDVAIAIGWADQGPGYAFVQVLTRAGGFWTAGPLSEWAYVLHVNDTRQETSYVFGVILVDLETSSASPEVVSVGAALGSLELRVWRLPS